MNSGDSYSRAGGRSGSSRDYPPVRRDREDRGDRDRDRRRSRSPEYRSNRSRRDGDTDVYSSSRSHREREREDRYSSRRDRDRDWERGERDRPRRDRRVDDDDHRQSRRGGRDRDRDRDFDERRHRRDDDGYRGGRERRRTPTPPPKKREPTPDLTNAIPVLERKRRMTQWDIKPPGYDNVTAEQAKLSGMFPLPGAPRQQAMDPSKLQAFASHRDNNNAGSHRGENNNSGHSRDGHHHTSGSSTSTGNNTVLRPTNSRQAKRLVVNNILTSTTKEALAQFFNLQMNGLNVVESTDPCLFCQLSMDGTFAIAEFKTSTDATVALAFDGITMEANGLPLQITRPKDYVVPALVDDNHTEPGRVSSVVPDSPNKISVSNIPVYLTDVQVMELLAPFGQLKSFVLVRDNETDESRGIAFCEFADVSKTEIAIAGLDKLEVGQNKLKARKASVGITQVAGVEAGVNAMSMLASTTVPNAEASRVVALMNMVTAEELMNDDDFAEICEDVRDECAKFGNIIDMKVPRPVGGNRNSPGIGKIFLKYESPESTTAALRALAGRKFADRTVVTTYFPEENFDVEVW